MFEGSVEGIADGSFEESAEASADGSFEGLAEGLPDGSFEGSVGGSAGGLVGGSVDGSFEGSVEGSADGSIEGLLEGSTDGSFEGVPVNGPFEGSLEGSADGSFVCSADGSFEGLVVGLSVGGAVLIKSLCIAYFSTKRFQNFALSSFMSSFANNSGFTCAWTPSNTSVATRPPNKTAFVEVNLIVDHNIQEAHPVKIFKSALRPAKLIWEMCSKYSSYNDIMT
jgi:hypothetical protein